MISAAEPARWLFAQRKLFGKIYAVDVSDTMLAVAKAKSGGTKQVTNIEFVQAGFLSYVHTGDPVDLVVSKVALHHLPDFWKQLALANINRWLKTGGLFYLFDIIFSAGLSAIDQRIDDYLDGFEKNAGVEFRGQVQTHIQKEYSTFDWVMEGMLKRAGFEKIRFRSFDGFSTEILCRKTRRRIGLTSRCAAYRRSNKNTDERFIDGVYRWEGASAQRYTPSFVFVVGPVLFTENTFAFSRKSVIISI